MYYLVQGLHFPFIVLITCLEDDGTQNAVTLQHSANGDGDADDGDDFDDSHSLVSFNLSRL